MDAGRQKLFLIFLMKLGSLFLQQEEDLEMIFWCIMTKHEIFHISLDQTLSLSLPSDNA